MQQETSVTTLERIARMERDVAVCGREIGEMKKKLDDQAAILQQLHAMNGNIMVLAEQVKQMVATSGKLDERLAAVEGKPSRRWDAVVAALITGGVGIAIGFLVK